MWYQVTRYPQVFCGLIVDQRTPCILEVTIIHYKKAYKYKFIINLNNNLSPKNVISEDLREQPICQFIGNRMEPCTCI